MHERLAGKVGMYTRFFDYANYRIPFSTFFVSVLTHFCILFSQLSVFGSAKVSYFEILCRVCNINPSIDSVKNWNDHFFWVDEFVVPANARFGWFSGTNIVKDRAPAPSEYNVEHVNTLIAQASPFLRDGFECFYSYRWPPELSASVEREFVRDASVAGGGDEGVASVGGQDNGVPALPTLPFITSPMTASPLEEGGDHTDSVTGPSLQTVGPSA
ncbi:hypothetical protein Tco_1059699, partial [Tanacetum coccineum]